MLSPVRSCHSITFPGRPTHALTPFRATKCTPTPSWSRLRSGGPPSTILLGAHVSRSSDNCPAPGSSCRVKSDSALVVGGGGSPYPTMPKPVFRERVRGPQDASQSPEEAAGHARAREAPLGGREVTVAAGALPVPRKPGQDQAGAETEGTSAPLGPWGCPTTVGAWRPPRKPQNTSTSPCAALFRGVTPPDSPPSLSLSMASSTWVKTSSLGTGFGSVLGLSLSHLHLRLPPAHTLSPRPYSSIPSAQPHTGKYPSRWLN